VTSVRENAGCENTRRNDCLPCCIQHLGRFRIPDTGGDEQIPGTKNARRVTKCWKRMGPGGPPRAAGSSKLPNDVTMMSPSRNRDVTAPWLHARRSRLASEQS
jgi:hypothetical protein